MYSEDKVRRADRGGMLSAYERWPALARRGYEAPSGILDGSYVRAFFLGMGGSAAAGDILSGWASGRKGVEIRALKGSVPSQGMKGSIAVAVSVSGKTEETVNMLKSAVKQGARAVAISGEGAVKDTAGKLRVPHIQVPPALAQRLMLPFLVYSSLKVLDAPLGLDCETEVKESFVALDAELKESSQSSSGPTNLAKALASTLSGSTPSIYADRVARGVGLRFKNAVNENSKRHAHFDEVPEAFHNDIEAWEDPGTEFTAVFLRHSFEGRRDSVKLDLMQNLLGESGKKTVEVRGRGGPRLSQLMSMTYRLDLASYYLAVALGRDPLTTSLLNRLKTPGPLSDPD